jgi:hypothetical protein
MRKEAMPQTSMRGPIGMPRGSLLRIEGGAGTVVHVWSGELWVTEEGSTEDHMLRPGQCLRIERGGATLAQAFKRSVVSLSASISNLSPRLVALVQ